MGNILSALIDWVSRLVQSGRRSENKIWYQNLIPSDLISQVLVVGIAAVFIFMVHYYQRLFFNQHEVANANEKIEEMHSRCKALNEKLEMWRKLSIAWNKKGQYIKDIDAGYLRDTIASIQTEMDSGMTLTTQLNVGITVVIDLMIGEGNLPDMPLKDFQSVLVLFENYLKDVPARSREIVYPHDLKQELEEMKNDLKMLDNMLRSSSDTETINKVEELRSVIKDLESTMIESSEQGDAVEEELVDMPLEGVAGNSRASPTLPLSGLLANRSTLPEGRVAGHNEPRSTLPRSRYYANRPTVPAGSVAGPSAILPTLPANPPTLPAEGSIAGSVPSSAYLADTETAVEASVGDDKSEKQADGTDHRCLYDPKDFTSGSE